jgi:hypothetical protein
MSNFRKTLCGSLYKSWKIFLFASWIGAGNGAYKFENTWHEFNKCYGKMQEPVVGGK